MATIQTSIISEKREKFLRLAEARTSKALKCIRLIRNLSNSYIYEYSSEEVQTILNALQNEVDELKRVFADKNSKNTTFRITTIPVTINN